MKIQSYKTLKSHSKFELKEKKSIFLANAHPVNSEDEVANLLNDLKKKYYDASHQCYAYRLLSGKTKFSDDGEPSGTAGIRILNAIDHYELQNCLVVVVRYFGGVKLGVGPLGKAYYSAAVNVLSKADIITKQPCYTTEIVINISYLEKLKRILISNGIKIVKIDYNSDIKIKCLIPAETWERVFDKIPELLRGKFSITKSDEMTFE